MNTNHHAGIFNNIMDSKILFRKHIPESIFKTVPGVVKSARAKMPELPPKERINSFAETDLVLQEDEALREANRCLSWR